MFNPSERWKAMFDSLSPLEQEAALARLAVDWGAATVAVGKLVQGDIIKPHYNRDGGISTPGVVLEMVIYEIFIEIRHVRFRRASMSDVDWLLLEVESEETGRA